MLGLRSMNNRLITEIYKNEGGLKSTVQHGIAMVEQKVRLKGLKILAGAKLPDGTLVEAGDLAFIKESTLHTQSWAKNFYESDQIEGQFIIVDMSQVEFIASQGF